MRLTMHLAHLLDQHFAEVIKTLRDLPANQRRRQRISFLRLHLQHSRGVQAARFQTRMIAS